MRKKYEILDFDAFMPVRCVMYQSNYIEPHMHDYFEINFILSGHCTFVVNGQTYHLSPEDVLTIDPHTLHELRSSDCAFICIQFEQTLFERNIPNAEHPSFFCNSAVQGDNEAFQAIRKLIARLVKNNADQQQGYALRNWAMIYELMDVLYNNFRFEPASMENIHGNRHTARITQIAQIVREHHTENLTLTQLSQMVHLSAPYLSKFFTQQFGMSFLEYLAQIRLNHAVNELLNTEKNIEEISADSGFPNSHAFVQIFKREFDMLPSAYRRKHLQRVPEAHNTLVLEQHDHMAILKKYLEQPVKTLAQPANIISSSVTLSARKAGTPLRHTWQETMIFGSAVELLRSDTQQMIRRMQRELGFRYIKIYDILSDELRVYNKKHDGTPVYNFINIDTIFDFILEAGLRPIVQLSFMPALLAKDPSRRLFNCLVSEPNSLTAWSDLIQVLTQHLIQRYGMEEVRQWHFYVWCQPNTPKVLYGFSTQQAFFDFYQCTYLAVKACDKQLSFGMPPIIYILEEDYKWHIEFLDWCKANSCMPDFLNYYYYDILLTKEIRKEKQTLEVMHSITLQDTPDSFRNFVNQVTSERKKMGLDNLPIFLTEWNNTPSHEDLLNDTCYKSCYIVKSILENYDQLDCFGYWAPSDWMGEAPIPNEMFFGGLGLFTANGIPKASYHALKLLRQLGDTCIGKGDGWFATKQGKQYTILLYNYRHFSRIYASGELFDMTFTDRYAPFAPEQTMDIHITLSDLEDGQYVVRETILNRKSGSAFDRWLEMGAMELDTEQELKALEALSTPICKKYLLETSNHRLELNAILETLEVRLLVIEA